MSTIQLRLAVLRRHRRLSQRALAAIAGVRPDTISELERGVSKGIQFETLARLCAALNCAPGEIFELRSDALDQHEIPVLGGFDEDEILLARLTTPQRVVDGSSFLAELQRQTPPLAERSAGSAHEGVMPRTAAPADGAESGPAQPAALTGQPG
jgi:putative transcriptional regulator